MNKELDPYSPYVKDGENIKKTEVLYIDGDVNTPYIYVNDHKVWVKGKRKIFLYYMWRITRINWFLKKYNQK